MLRIKSWLDSVQDKEIAQLMNKENYEEKLMEDFAYHPYRILCQFYFKDINKNIHDSQIYIFLNPRNLKPLIHINLQTNKFSPLSQIQIQKVYPYLYNYKQKMSNQQQKQITPQQINNYQHQFQQLNTFFTSVNTPAYNLMDLQTKTRKWKEIKILCKQLLHRNPNSAQINLRLAQIYQYQKNYTEAKSYYIKALTLDKKLLAARAALSVLYMKLGIGVRFLFQFHFENYGGQEVIDREKRREMEPFDQYFRYK